MVFFTEENMLEGANNPKKMTLIRNPFTVEEITILPDLPLPELLDHQVQKEESFN